jgi:hypothetical protein
VVLTTSEGSPSYVAGALNESFAPKLVTETFPDLDVPVIVPQEEQDNVI